jgi:23S rRNA pseudouridine1911/1915/1917 synthase
VKGEGEKVCDEPNAEKHADESGAESHDADAESLEDDGAAQSYGETDASRDDTAAELESATLAFVVSQEEAGARLDAYLSAHVEATSRTRIQQLIEDGDASVGGRARKSSYKLRAGERVEIELVAPPPLDLAPENIPLEIVHEDEDFLVVNKPAGMVVHPAAGVHSGTLANALAFHFQKLSAHGGPLRPGLVHRLDRDTSGLIIVAKTGAAHENLTDQFRARTVFKSYVALVYGRVREETGRIEEPLGRDPRHRTRMATLRGGRAALSLWRVRRRFERFTLLDVEIKTGRTHQIRVHLTWLKHPVVGDETYGGGRDRNLPEAQLRARIHALGRQFLHAEQLGLQHPRTGEPLRFRAPLPANLQAFLDHIEKG